MVNPSIDEVISYLKNNTNLPKLWAMQIMASGSIGNNEGNQFISKFNYFERFYMLRRKNKESLTSFLYSKSVCRGTDLSKLKGLSVVFNTESIYHFYVNKDYHEYVLRCKNVFIDGAMLVFGARLIGWKINRYHGPDLLSDLEEQGICKNSVLIGGSNSNHILEKNSVVKKWIKLPYTKHVGLLFQRQSHKLIVTMTYAWYLLGSPKQELLSQSSR